MSMKKYIIVVALAVIASLGSGQSESNETLLVLTIKPVKQNFKVKENWEYEVRIENPSDETLRIPKNIDGHYLPKMIGSDGKEVLWEYSISLMDKFDEQNTVELAPGFFYAKKCTWSGLEHAGKYTFCILLYSPKNIGDSLSNYWEGQIESNRVKIIVSE